jgi:hypothetical protein
MHTQQFKLTGLFTDSGIPCLCLHHGIVIPEKQPRSLTVFGQAVHIPVKIVVPKSFKDHYLVLHRIFFNPGNHLVQHVLQSYHIIIVYAKQDLNAGEIFCEIVKTLDAAHESIGTASCGQEDTNVHQF